MMENFYQTLRKRDRIIKNYLADFIIEASQKFEVGNYAKYYVWIMLKHMAHFGDWLQKKRTPLDQIDAKHVDLFLASSHFKNASRETLLEYRGALKLLLSVIKKRDRRVNAIQIEIERYSNYLRDVRGLLESTIALHQKDLQEFLVSMFPNQRIRIRALKPTVVRAYVEKLPTTKANSKRKTVCAMLSGYFRFLETENNETKHLISAIPSIPVRRRSISPTVLSEST